MTACMPKCWSRRGFSSRRILEIGRDLVEGDGGRLFFFDHRDLGVRLTLLGLRVSDMRDKPVAEFHNRANEVHSERRNKACPEERARYFLARAAEAEQQAEKLEDPASSNSSRHIAESYRQVALSVLKLKL